MTDAEDRQNKVYMKVPSKSSVVLVAGSALHDLQAVMEKVDSLGHDLKMIPYVVVLLVQEKNIIMNISRHARSPPIVSFDRLCVGKKNCYIIGHWIIINTTATATTPGLS
jgi:hypothetical protein